MSGSFAKTVAGVVVVASVLSCSGGGGETVQPGDWKLVLAHDGGSVTVPLEVMNVWLVEDENYPESFNIEGAAVKIGGTFPAGLNVGYEENWNALLGKTIVMGAGNGDPYEPGEAFVELSPGERSRVSGGTIIFEKFTGKVSGSEGDMTLTGRIMLVVETGGGTKNVMGTIAVHCVTWG